MARVAVEEEVSLYYQDLGDGPAVVLVHGGCMSHRVWESQVHALLQEGFRVITPDLRGHGRSDKPVSEYTAETHAVDIADLTDALGVEEFALVGWSLGATIASTFAGAYGDRLSGLVLVSSNIFNQITPRSSPGGKRNELPLQRMIENQRRNRPAGMKRFVSGMFGSEADDETSQWLWNIGMQTPMRVAIKTLEIYADPEVDALREALSALDVPGAVFHGVNDKSATIADAEAIATDLFTDGTFVRFENSGHVPFLEEAARFDEELIAFLRSCPVPTS